ncbi:MAG: RluA family pseudouridine synthase [Roseibacillus sp.]
MNRRPCRIKAAEDGLTFIEVLAGRFPGKLSDEEWRKVFRDGLIVSNGTGEVIDDPELQVVTGHQYVRLLPEWVEPPVGTDLKVIYEDEVLLIIDKPAPLPMHEGGRFCKNTLMWLMNTAWPELDVRYAHRLDAETSGALVCVKGRKYRSAIQTSFEQGDVSKVYLARVQGYPRWEEKLIENTVPAEGRVWGKPLEAQTEMKVMERLDDGTTLIEARPLTGRTHQIRVHLWQEGLPIIGDRLYLAEGKLGKAEIAGLGAEPLALRSWKISFPHPMTGEMVSFEAEGRL